jgi:hypothetical protein
MNIFLINWEAFPVSIFYIAVRLFFLSIAVALFLSLFTNLLPTKIRQVIIVFIFSVSICFWIQGNIINWNYGILTGQEINWGEYFYRGVIDVTVWLACITIFLIFYKKIYKQIFITSLSLVFIQLCWFGYNAISYTADMKNNKKYTSDWQVDYSKFPIYSSDKNYIVILADTFAKHLFDEVLEKDETVFDIFDVFTYYPDAVSGYPTTVAAVPYIITGTPYKNERPMQEYLADSFLKNSISSKFINKGFEAELYTGVSYISPETSTAVIHKNFISYNKVYYTLLLTSIYRYSPQTIKKFLYNSVSFYSVDIAINNAVAKPFESKYSNISWDLARLDLIESQGALAKIKPLFKFIHFTGIHGPILYRHDGIDFIPAETPPSDIENAETFVVFLRRLLAKYKDLGIYDDASIFIIADHGLLVWPTEKIEGYLKNMPLALHKPPYARGKMQISNRPYYSPDLYETILFEAGLSKNMGLYSDAPSYRERSYLFYAWRDANWRTPYLPTMTEYKIIGNVNESINWIKTGKYYSKKQSYDYNLSEIIYQFRVSPQLEGNSIFTDVLVNSDVSILYKEPFLGKIAFQLAINPSELRNKSDLILKLYVTPIKYKYMEKKFIKFIFNEKELSIIEVNESGIIEFRIPNKLIKDVNDLIFEFPNSSADEKSFVFHSFVIDKDNSNINFETEIKSKFPPYFLTKGEKILFNSSLLDDVLCFGWGTPHKIGSSSEGKMSIVRFYVKEQPQLLRFFASSYYSFPQRVRISINGFRITELVLTNRSEPYFDILIPEIVRNDLKNGGLIEISFDFPDAVSPLSLGRGSKDSRQLALLFESVEFVE